MTPRKKNNSKFDHARPVSFGKLALSLLLVAAVALITPVSVLLANNQSETTRGEPTPNEISEPIRISLVGDVCLADGWGADVAHAHKGLVVAAFSRDILSHLHSSTITYANHEFTMSYRGEPLNKYYTFCASPAYIGYWEQLGVDIVGLANNHAFDYGEEAFLDTLALLDANGIRHVGAGIDLAEAMAPVCFTIDGYCVAFVAADRSQKGDEVRAQAAAANTPGVLFCFDDELFLHAVTNASLVADYVIAIPHWGTEYSTELEDVQIELAHKLIDAGADAVIGSHPHILQGIDFYNGKPIAYSLGNFWFNEDDTYTVIFDITIDNGVPSFSIVPALQSDKRVLSSPAISADVIAYLREISPNVEISEDGTIHPL